MRLLYLFLLLITFSAHAEEKLNCDTAYTTPDINRCAAIEKEAAEKVMEKYLAYSKKRYADDRVVIESINKAQESWLLYRQSHCGSVFDTWRDGTIRTVMSLNCSTQLTQQRTYELWRAFLTYVDSTPPILPEPDRE